jgi:hypothetical protein
MVCDSDCVRWIGFSKDDGILVEGAVVPYAAIARFR